MDIQPYDGIDCCYGFGFYPAGVDAGIFSRQPADATITPVIPSGGELLVLGLVGTTVVPCNLLLASGISKGQTIPMMRVGLIISILLGGLITGAILVAGTAIHDFSSFSVLITEFKTQAGKGASLALAIGLFAAGFSSTITAPYASSIIAATVYGVKQEKKLRVVRVAVLMTCFMIGIMGLRPIKVILAVQVLNGFMLPLLVIFMILIVSDPILIPERFRHGWYYNVLLMVVLAAVLLISLSNVDKAIISGFSTNSSGHLLIVYGLTSRIVISVAGLVFLRERK